MQNFNNGQTLRKRPVKSSTRLCEDRMFRLFGASQSNGWVRPLGPPNHRERQVADSVMDRHWDAYCGLSIVHFLAFPECQSGQGPILETVSAIAHDDFFSGIEVSRINDVQVRKQVD